MRFLTSPNGSFGMTLGTVENELDNALTSRLGKHIRKPHRQSPPSVYPTRTSATYDKA